MEFWNKKSTPRPIPVSRNVGWVELRETHHESRAIGGSRKTRPTLHFEKLFGPSPMPNDSAYPKIAQLKTVAGLRARLDELGIFLPIDDKSLSAEKGSPLAQPIQVAGHTVANRWCIHPMEGWDANRDGSP